MFRKMMKALFTPTPAARWDAPRNWQGREAHRRHIDQEAAFRAHLMRHTHYR